jgi:hypothetical protein
MRPQNLSPRNYGARAPFIRPASADTLKKRAKKNRIIPWMEIIGGLVKSSLIHQWFHFRGRTAARPGQPGDALWSATIPEGASARLPPNH